MRENKEKQALGDLMIKPVQRIPRYELLVKVSDFKIELWACCESYSDCLVMESPLKRRWMCCCLFKDLLKHTPEDHPDHPYLLDAQRDIKRLAEKINKGRRSAEEAEREARVIQEIEAHIEGVEHVRHLLTSADFSFVVWALYFFLKPLSPSINNKNNKIKQ